MSSNIHVDATIDDLSEALTRDADVFHFAGHGEVDRLYLVDGKRQAWPLDAEQLAVNLRARGIQLVVLGACESGVRDRAERWSGVATRLVANRVPAVIAMQYLVNDGMAIAFSKALYRSLAAGWSLDAAVGTGRLAMYNHATGGYDASKLRDIWPDWGVPVLYAQSDTAVSLGSVEAEDERAQLEEELVQRARIRTADVKKGGRVVGASGASGVIDVKVETGAVAGRVVGSEDFEGTKAEVEIDAGTVEEGGEIVESRTPGRGPAGGGDDRPEHDRRQGEGLRRSHLGRRRGRRLDGERHRALLRDHWGALGAGSPRSRRGWPEPGPPRRRRVTLRR